MFGWLLTASPALQVDVALLHLFGEIRSKKHPEQPWTTLWMLSGGWGCSTASAPRSPRPQWDTHTQSTANAVKKLIFQQSSPPRGIARRRRVGRRTGAEAQSVLEWLPAHCQPFSAGDGWVAGGDTQHHGSFLSSPVLPLSRRFHNPSKQGKAPSVAG